MRMRYEFSSLGIAGVVSIDHAPPKLDICIDGDDSERDVR